MTENEKELDRRAEIIIRQEKRIAELEKENKDLRDNYDLFKAIAEPEIERLKKENAKLKTDYEVLSCSVGDFGELQDKLEEEQRKNNGLSDNLTKAKEIIKGLLSCCRNYPQENAEKVKRAEQFLRETDIDNAIQKANEGLDLDKIADEVEQDIKEQKVK